MCFLIGEKLQMIASPFQKNLILDKYSERKITMKRIIFIMPWFGPLRKDFDFWLKSAELNRSVDFLVPTDQYIKPPPIM